MFMLIPFLDGWLQGNWLCFLLGLGGLAQGLVLNDEKLPRLQAKRGRRQNEALLQRRPRCWLDDLEGIKELGRIAVIESSD